MAYYFIRNCAGLLLRLFFGLRVSGAKNIPRTGPVILAANHLSFLDPIAIGAASARRVTFIARADIFRYPVLSWILRGVGAIPVERGTSDLGAIKTAIRVLQAGGCFAIFPEGTRSRDGRFHSFKTGVSAIAIRTGATIIPVAVIGGERAWPAGGKPRLFKAIRVTFGTPLHLTQSNVDKHSLEAATLMIENAVKALLPEKYL